MNHSAHSVAWNLNHIGEFCFSSHVFLLYKLSGHIATQKDLKNESNETKVIRFHTKVEGEQKGRSPPHWEKIVEEIRWHNRLSSLFMTYLRVKYQEVALLHSFEIVGLWHFLPQGMTTLISGEVIWPIYVPLQIHADRQGCTCWSLWYPSGQAHSPVLYSPSVSKFLKICPNIFRSRGFFFCYRKQLCLTTVGLEFCSIFGQEQDTLSLLTFHCNLAGYL